MKWDTTQEAIVFEVSWSFTTVVPFIVYKVRNFELNLKQIF